MLQKMLASAMIAGCAAWLLAALLHFGFVQNYILLGETYETGAMVHFSAAPAASHTHAGGEAVAHEHDAASGQSDVQRNIWTVVFHGLVYVAYALILVAGFGLAQVFGHSIGARDGLLWGIAGFVAFQLAPALGLAPELPGTLAADLWARQIWWLCTVLATAIGLALLAYGRGPIAVAGALVMLAAPHLIGAPSLDGFSGVAPPEVAAAFSARVLGVGLFVWALMGWVAGLVWSGNADRSVAPA